MDPISSTNFIFFRVESLTVVYVYCNREHPYELLYAKKYVRWPTMRGIGILVHYKHWNEVVNTIPSRLYTETSVLFLQLVHSKILEEVQFAVLHPRIV